MKFFKKNKIKIWIISVFNNNLCAKYIKEKEICTWHPTSSKSIKKLRFKSNYDGYVDNLERLRAFVTFECNSPSILFKWPFNILSQCRFVFEQIWNCYYLHSWKMRWRTNKKQIWNLHVEIVFDFYFSFVSIICIKTL